VLKPSVPKTVRIATKDTFVGELNQTDIRYDLTPSRISGRLSIEGTPFAMMT